MSFRADYTPLMLASDFTTALNPPGGRSLALEQSSGSIFTSISGFFAHVFLNYFLEIFLLITHIIYITTCSQQACSLSLEYLDSVFLPGTLALVFIILLLLHQSPLLLGQWFPVGEILLQIYPMMMAMTLSPLILRVTTDLPVVNAYTIL